MSPADTRIVFFGTDDFSGPTLKALIKAGYDVVCVVTKPDSATGRGRTITAPAVKTIALAHGIAVLQPSRASDVIAQISALAPDVGVVVAYGKILPQALLDLFGRGVVNIHTSLLPRYRGASPIEATIANGDFQTGVTLMQLDAGMDTGPIYDQYIVKLKGNESRPGLYDSLSQAGADFLIEKLPSILDGSLTPTPQDETQAVHVGLLRKADGQIAWSEPATVIERKIRAYRGWPGSQTVIDNTPVTITAVHIGDSQPLLETKDTGTVPGVFFKNAVGQLCVTTGQCEIIIDRLKPAGKREMTGRDFLAGHPMPRTKP